MKDDAYECAMSGMRVEPGEYYDKDGLDDIPEGWIKISFKRRLTNSEWMNLQEAKNDLMEAALSQLPPGQPKAVVARQRNMIKYQVNSQFSGLEQKIEPFVMYEEAVFISPPEDNEDILEAVNSMRRDLGMAEMALFSADLGEGEPEDPEEEDDEKEGEKEEK